MKLLITSGRGPIECRIAVEEIVERLRGEAETHGLDTGFVHGPQDREGNCGSIVVTVDGESAAAFARSWIGTIQWIAKSTIRVGHKRKNWFISVSELSEGQPIIKLNPDDIRYETFRAGGPGGQHQNTTDSAVRAVHVPTNTVVVIREGRSQHQNKKIAVRRLGELLDIQAEMDRGAIQEQAWRCHDALERGNPVRVFRE